MHKKSTAVALALAFAGSSLAACDSETCRWQIEHATQVPTVHPVALVHQAMGLS